MTHSADAALAAAAVGQSTPGSSTVDTAGRAYRSVLAELAKGVTVVATRGAGGPVGSTASAVTSLSLHPPLVLVSLAVRSRTLHHLRQHGAFSISILQDRHRQVADTFAGALAHQDRFASVAHHLDHGTPVLDDALAWITCQLHATFPGGDHVIVVGRVTATHRASGEPLIRHRGGYRRIATDPIHDRAGSTSDPGPSATGDS